MPLRGSIIIVPLMVNVAPAEMIQHAMMQLTNFLTVKRTLTIRNVPMHLMNSTAKMIPIRLLINISHVLRVAIIIQMKISIR